MAPHEVRRLIEQAVGERRVVRIRHRAEFRGQVKLTEREIEIYDFDDEYIDAFCRLRQERRSFRVDRIMAVDLSNEHYEIDPEVSDGIDHSGWANRQGDWKRSQTRDLRRKP